MQCCTDKRGISRRDFILRRACWVRMRHVGYSQVLFAAASILIQTAACGCFGEISVRRQGHLQVCPITPPAWTNTERLCAHTHEPPHSHTYCTGELAGAQCGRGTGRTVSVPRCESKPAGNEPFHTLHCSGDSRRCGRTAI